MIAAKPSRQKQEVATGFLLSKKGTTVNVSRRLKIIWLPLVWGPQRKFKRRNFSNDAEVKIAVRNWLKTQPVEFYRKKYVRLLKDRKRLHGNQEITLKSNYDMLMLYILFDIQFVYL